MNLPPPILRIKRLRPSAKIPQYATPGSAGMDLYADLHGMSEMVRWRDERVVLAGGKVDSRLTYGLAPGEKVLIPCGFACEIPPGYEGSCRSRSGLALKKGLVVLNSPGTVDSDYRGEMGALLFNTSKEVVYIEDGDRIAQLVITPVVQPIIEEVSNLSDTTRGSGGFGSTGTK